MRCRSVDFYVGEWIDRLDELKTNIDERQVLAHAGAFALGRKTDELIVQALVGGSVTAGDGSTGLSRAKVLQAFEDLGIAEVPDDGQRFAMSGGANGRTCWTAGIRQRGVRGRRRTTLAGHPGQALARHDVAAAWRPDPERRGAVLLLVPQEGGRPRIRQEVTTDITWHGDRAAHFVANSMSQGAGLIDPTGVIKLPCREA